MSIGSVPFQQATNRNPFKGGPQGSMAGILKVIQENAARTGRLATSRVAEGAQRTGMARNASQALSAGTIGFDTNSLQNKQFIMAMQQFLNQDTARRSAKSRHQLGTRALDLRKREIDRLPNFSIDTPFGGFSV